MSEQSSGLDGRRRLKESNQLRFTPFARELTHELSIHAQEDLRW